MGLLCVIGFFVPFPSLHTYVWEIVLGYAFFNRTCRDRHIWHFQCTWSGRTHLVCLLGERKSSSAHVLPFLFCTKISAFLKSQRRMTFENHTVQELTGFKMFQLICFRGFQVSHGLLEPCCWKNTHRKC